MPYRSELKRPDLKGQFPCTVCGKIFCHSSSLSRHRMQAHFKSFTCTQCNKEISSSETLRSHMFRAHSISRMFMCRCCNWAFPDKTSLHIHMQSMARSGHPGDVAVLARSSTETGPEGSPSQEMDCSSPGSRPESRNTVSPEANSSSRYGSNNNSNSNNGGGKSVNFLQRSIFPAMANERSDILSTLSASNNEGTNQWLSLWLANNPLPTNNPLSLTLSDISSSLLSNGQTQVGSSSTERESSCADADNVSENNGSSLYDEIRNDSPMETISEACGISIDAKNDRKNKRKSRRPMQLSSVQINTAADPLATTALEIDETAYQPPCKVTVTAIENGKELLSQSSSIEQPSPTVSDSHTSGSSTQGSGLVSPKKCFECQESSTHYESEIQQLRSQLSEELDKRAHCDKCDVANERIDQIQKQIDAIMTAIGSQNNVPGEIRHLLDELSQIITV